MLPSITDEEYKYLDSKYGKLILKAASSIYGDSSFSPEDYAQDIWFLVLDYLPKYLRMHNKTLIEFCEDPKFNGYIKQWIWTAKNNIGRKITERVGNVYLFPSFGNSENSLEAPVEYSDNFENLAQVCNEEDIPSILQEMKEGTSIYDRTLSSIAFDADSVKNNGAINVAAISRNLNVPANLINSEIQKIKNEFKHVIK